MRIILPYLLFLSITVVAFGESPEKPVATIAFDQIDLDSASQDQIVLTVKAHVISKHKVTVKRVEFQDLEANGVPLNLRPIEHRFELPVNEAVPLEPLRVTMQTRDLQSLQPLIDAVADERITVSGRAHLDLELNFMERLLSGHPSGRADVEIRAEIPFDVPGAEAGRAAMLLALKALQLVIGVGGSVIH